MSTVALGWVVRDRTVYTYAPHGVAYSVITGYGDRDTFVVEHVMVSRDAPAGTLIGAVCHGLQTAWEHFACVVFCVSTTQRDGNRLAMLGERLGFVEYAQEGELTWFAAHRPA